jgi:hypothetical protein
VAADPGLLRCHGRFPAHSAKPPGAIPARSMDPVGCRRVVCPRTILWNATHTPLSGPTGHSTWRRRPFLPGAARDRDLHRSCRRSRLAVGWRIRRGDLAATRHQEPAGSELESHRRAERHHCHHAHPERGWPASKRLGTGAGDPAGRGPQSRTAGCRRGQSLVQPGWRDGRLSRAEPVCVELPHEGSGGGCQGS